MRIFGLQSVKQLASKVTQINPTNALKSAKQRIGVLLAATTVTTGATFINNVAPVSAASRTEICKATLSEVMPDARGLANKMKSTPWHDETYRVNLLRGMKVQIADACGRNSWGVRNFENNFGYLLKQGYSGITLKDYILEAQDYARRARNTPGWTGEGSPRETLRSIGNKIANSYGQTGVNEFNNQFGDILQIKVPRQTKKPSRAVRVAIKKKPITQRYTHRKFCQDHISSLLNKTTYLGGLTVTDVYYRVNGDGLNCGKYLPKWLVKEVEDQLRNRQTIQTIYQDPAYYLTIPTQPVINFRY